MLFRSEATDDFEPTAKKSSASGKKSGSKSNNNNSSSNSGGGSKELYCMLHGKGNHASEDCHKLKDSVKKLKAGPSSGSKGKSDDKKSNWKAKADAAASSGKKDLAALIKEAVSTATKSDKKRKSPSKEKDFNVAEALKDFNYTDELKQLSISSSDDELSVGEVSC